MNNQNTLHYGNIQQQFDMGKDPQHHHYSANGNPDHLWHSVVHVSPLCPLGIPPSMGGTIHPLPPLRGTRPCLRGRVSYYRLSGHIGRTLYSPPYRVSEVFRRSTKCASVLREGSNLHCDARTGKGEGLGGSTVLQFYSLFSPPHPTPCF